MSITPHPSPSCPHMFGAADFSRSYVLYPDVECNIPRWGSESDYAAWNYARGLLVETSRALQGTPMSLHYRELLTRQPHADPTVPAHLPVGHEITAIVRDTIGQLITIVDHRETAPYGTHGDFWRLTVNGIVPVHGLAKHPPSLPWTANHVRRHLHQQQPSRLARVKPA